MSRLIIKNIGPIKDVDIKLNKVNVFIGQQSSGKSTIAKIISFCSWLEKKVHNEEMFLVKERKLLPVYKLITIFSPILGRTL